MIILAPKKLGLDESIKKLDKIASELELGNLDLENSLKKYEEGINIYRKCYEMIKEAELQIEYLNKNLNEDGMGKNDI